MAVTMDVISSYCFGVDPAYLDTENFGLEWKEIINGAWQKRGIDSSLSHHAVPDAIIPADVSTKG